MASCILHHTVFQWEKNKSTEIIKFDSTSKEKAKWLSEEALQIAVKRSKEEKQKAKEKRKDIPIWMQSSKEEQGEIRKPSSMVKAKK